MPWFINFHDMDQLSPCECYFLAFIWTRASTLAIEYSEQPLHLGGSAADTPIYMRVLTLIQPLVELWVDSPN